MNIKENNKSSHQKINYKIIVSFILGAVLTSTVYAATSLGATSVSYNNSSSKLSATSVQGAIDEIYNNATGGNITYNNPNIVGAYQYDYNKCKTGDENTCKKIDCPNNTTKNTCPAGTIIKYKVNGSTTKTFNVLHDDISKLTLQQNEDTVSSQWYSSEDNSKGPTTALSVLESATNSWSNVNTINYTLGTTVFRNNAYTGCSLSDTRWNCTTNRYTLSARSTKARMITAQEATELGCRYATNSCPTWLATGEYWTMSAWNNNTYDALIFSRSNVFIYAGKITASQGVRAVVEINK